MRSAVDLVVLDIAGTTIEEHGAVYVALEDAVVAAGGRPGRADIDAWMGADKHQAIAHLLTAADGPDSLPCQDAELVEGVYQNFRRLLSAAYADRPPAPIKGVPQALARLRAHGVAIALTTGFTREVTTPLLRSVGWDCGVVDTVVTVDDVPAGRPAPYLVFRAMERLGIHQVARVLVAGDTARDLEAGTNAGAGFVVGVLTGGQDAQALGAARHTHLLPSAALLPELVLATQPTDHR